jgi:membrane protease YdiL (CAAX protease family)
MPARYWLFVLLTLALTAFMGYGAYTTARLLKTWVPDRNLLLMPAENLLRLALIILCIALGLLSGLSLSQLGWVWPQTTGQLIRQVVAGIGWGAGLALFFYLATRWVTARGDGRFYSDTIIAYITPGNGWEWVLVALAMAGVALLEELLFRSLLLGGFAPLAPVWLLVLGLGALFGLMHSPQGAVGMVGAGLAGVIFGVLFLWSGGLLLPLTAHYAANMVQVTAAMFMDEEGS